MPRNEAYIYAKNTYAHEYASNFPKVRFTIVLL